VKEHGRLQRWRVQRKCVSPEEAGLCGCRQFVAVWRERHYLRGGRTYKQEEEYSYYVSSGDPRAYHEAALLEAIRGHWDAIENGSHHRRDVGMGEDASGISKRTQAHMMASLRNLTLGLFERQKHGNKDGFPSWRRKMTASKAIRMLSSKK
jgi:hypothetical protein